MCVCVFEWICTVFTCTGNVPDDIDVHEITVIRMVHVCETEMPFRWTSDIVDIVLLLLLLLTFECDIIISYTIHGMHLRIGRRLFRTLCGNMYR